jgi:hypothetical protein
MKERLLDVLTPQSLSAIREKVFATLADQETKLKAQAAQQKSDEYTAVLDALFASVRSLLSSDDVIKNILTEPKEFEGWYQTVTGDQAFISAANKDQRQMPRVLAMIVLSGTCANAAADAKEVLADIPDHAKEYFDGLQSLYEGYMADAFSFAKGEKKTVVLESEEEAAKLSDFI